MQMQMNQRSTLRSKWWIRLQGFGLTEYTPQSAADADAYEAACAAADEDEGEVEGEG